MTANSTFAAMYVGSRGIGLFRSIDANAPLPTSYLAVPNPALGQVREMQSEGYQKANALELTFRGKPTKYFAGQVQYTLSKTYNNTSGITFFPANSYDPSNEWARSDLDRRPLPLKPPLTKNSPLPAWRSTASWRGTIVD